jgi:hypothetical protein
MKAFFLALGYAVLMTLIAFGPLAGTVWFFSWRAFAAVALAILAIMIFLAFALVTGGLPWNPSGIGHAVFAIGIVITAVVIGVAFWVAGKQTRFSSRAAALLFGYASLVWAIWRYDRTRASWDLVRHPENLAAYLAAAKRLDAIMRDAGQTRGASAPAVVPPKPVETAQPHAESARRSARPLVLLDRAGKEHVIDANSYTDIMSLGIRSTSDPDFRKTLSVVNDPDVLIHTTNRKRIYVLSPEHEEFVRDPGGDIMFRTNKMYLPGASDVAFYNRSSGRFDVTPYAWLVNVLGMDREKAGAIYIKHMGEPAADR